jgi:hypothetical protein
MDIRARKLTSRLLPGSFGSTRTPTTGELLKRRDRIVARAAVLFRLSRVESGVRALHELESATIDERTLELTDRFLPGVLGGRRLIATFDPNRRPRADEVVVIYGNYPLVFDSVVINNPIKRHLADFWKFEHDAVEYDERWEGVDHIFVINSRDRPDRWDGVVRELGTARAPLHRLTRIEAVKLEPSDVRPGLSRQARGQLGAVRAHRAALAEAAARSSATALVLEDDFCFTSDLEQHLDDLRTFLARRYDYTVCLIATCRDGATVPMDDLLARSFQECTGAAGYLVSEEGITALLDIFADASRRLEQTGDIDSFAVDRCWSVLQPPGTFLVFRRKFGFQVSSFSDLEQKIARYLD